MLARPSWLIVDAGRTGGASAGLRLDGSACPAHGPYHRPVPRTRSGQLGPSCPVSVVGEIDPTAPRPTAPRSQAGAPQGELEDPTLAELFSVERLEQHAERRDTIWNTRCADAASIGRCRVGGEAPGGLSAVGLPAAALQVGPDQVVTPTPNRTCAFPRIRRCTSTAQRDNG